jgi:phosphoserine phosphatase
MKFVKYFSLLVLFIFLTGSVNAADPGKKLSKMNWSDKNYQVLNNLITDYGTGGKHYDKNKPSYVVLDWDQTCAHFDVEEATMRYQLSNLRFKMTKEQFAGLLKDEIKGIKQLSADYKNIVLKDINQDLINDYNFLYDNYSGLKGTMSLEEIKKTPQYNDFITKVAFLYDGYCDTPGIDATYGYPWVLYLFAGHTEAEVKSLTMEAIKYELNNKLGKLKWETPADFTTKAGPISYSYKTGLRVYPEMQNLIDAFEANGIDVFVVSASYKPVVQVFSGIGNFGYNVPEDRVIAMELQTKDGVILPEYKQGWVQTQRMGKVEAIKAKIQKELGKNYDPIFSAADSDGDYEMSTEFPGMKLTLVFNRVKGGDIGKLCKSAVNEKDSSTPRFILQGRDENLGMLIPVSETILLGKTDPQLLK